MIRKKIIYVMIFALLFNAITSISISPFTTVNAEENTLSTEEKEIRSELANGLNIEDKEIQIDIESNTNQTNVIFNAKSSSSVQLEGQVIVNELTSEIKYLVNDNESKKVYDVNYDTNNPELVTFIDSDTGKKYTVNIEESQLAWVPIAIAIGGVVVRGVISIASKNLTKNAIKIAGKTYKGQAKKKAKNALKKYKGETFKVGKTGKTVKLSSGKLEHILTGHHPKYWKGADKKSFFDPNLSIKTIRNYIKQTISSNEKHIAKRVKGNSKAHIEVYKKINKVNYKIVINVGEKKQLTVSSFYPVSKIGKNK